jgi:hypothetical protein
MTFIDLGVVFSDAASLERGSRELAVAIIEDGAAVAEMPSLFRSVFCIAQVDQVEISVFDLGAA